MTKAITKTKKSIYEKIFSVQQKVAMIKKEGYNSFQKYKYVKEEDILAEIKPLLKEEGLLLISSCESFDETRFGETEKSILISVKVKYTLIDINTKEEVVSYGYGAGKDTGDKGIYKALTGSMKYYLMKTFLMSGGDEPERQIKKAKETKADKFKRATSMINQTRNIDGLIDLSERVKASKIYNKSEKEKLSKLISERVDSLESKK